MADAIAERVRRYILDGSDEDLRRQMGVAETTREMASSAFRRGFGLHAATLLAARERSVASGMVLGVANQISYAS